MARIVTYNNEAFPSAEPLAQSAQDSQSQAYHLDRILKSGFNEFARGVSSFQDGLQSKQDAASKLADQEDIANLTAQYAVNDAKNTAKWSQTLAGADPSKIHDVQQKFMQDATAGYDAIHESATTDAGRLYSMKARATAFSSQYTSTAADAMSLSSAHAVAAVTGLSTSYSDAAYHDPGSFKAQVEKFDLGIDAQSKVNDLSAADALKLKNDGHEAIAQSSIKGMIENNPLAAKQALESGQFDGILKGADIAKANAQADMALVHKTAGATAATNAAEKAQKSAADKTYSDLVAAQPVDPKTGHVMIQPDFFNRVQQIDGMPAAARKAAIQWGTTEMHRTDKVTEGPSDQATKDNFVKQINDGTINKHDLDVARANNLINAKDYSMFKGMTSSTNENKPTITALNKFVGGMKQYIMTPNTYGLEDAWGKQRWNEFQSDAMLKVNSDVAAGKKPAEIQKELTDMVKSYQVDPKQVQAEEDRESKNNSPMVPAPPVNKPDARVPMDQLYQQHSDNAVPAQQGSLDGSGKPKTVDGGLPAVAGNAYPALLGTQPGRQPLDMSKVVPSVMSKWERVQGVLGQQYPIVSGYRDPAVNAAAGGAKDSEHMRGEAIDIDVRNVPIPQRLKLMQVAGNLGFTGVGVYPNSIHLDIGNRRMWGPDHTHTSIPDWAAPFYASHMIGAKAEQQAANPDE